MESAKPPNPPNLGEIQTNLCLANSLTRGGGTRIRVKQADYVSHER